VFDTTRRYINTDPPAPLRTTDSMRTTALAANLRGEPIDGVRGTSVLQLLPYMELPRQVVRFSLVCPLHTTDDLSLLKPYDPMHTCWQITDTLYSLWTNTSFSKSSWYVPAAHFEMSDQRVALFHFPEDWTRTIVPFAKISSWHS
jgi:hypothetical protein